MILFLKLLRELRSQRGQVVAVVTVTALGILTFVATYAGYLDLRESYAATERTLRLADRHVSVVSISADEREHVAALPGVAAADARVQVSLPLVIPRGRLGSGERARLVVEARIITIPDGHQPALDRLVLQSGALPGGAGEILLEKHLAEQHGLQVGDALEIALSGGSRRLRVTGVAVSAEYLFVTRNADDLMPSPTEFGVAWMGRDGLRELTRDVLAAAPEAQHRFDAAGGEAAAVRVAASDAAGNQLLIDLAPGASAPAVLSGVRARLGPARVLGVTPRDELLGVKLLRMDLDGFRGMAAFFPLFFLGIGSFIVAAIVGRAVDAQRVIIGTLSALGVSSRRILAHYLTFSMLLAGAGSVLGAALGHLAGGALTREYAAELGLPFITVAPHYAVTLAGMGAGLVVALVAGLASAHRAASLAPAEAMRPPSPPSGRAVRLARGLPESIPLLLRMALRDLLRRPLRNLATAAGVAAALVLVLTSGAVFDSMRAVAGTLFDQASRYDVRVELLSPGPMAALSERARALPGVTRAEALLTIPARVGGPGGRRDAFVEATAPDAELIRSVDSQGRELRPGDGGVVLSRGLAKEVGAALGDTVEVEALPSGPRARFTVQGLTDAAFGSSIAMRLPDAQRAFGLDLQANALVVSAQPGARLAVREALQAEPGVARVHDLADLRQSIRAMMGLGWAMMGVMLLFSVVLAAAILFNTATLGILERKRELATMRALGQSMRRITAEITLENGALALVGLALGLPVSLLSIRRLLALYQSDIFSLPLVLSWSTLGGAVAGVVAVLLLAQWPALRDLSRADLAEAVRTRQ